MKQVFVLGSINYDHVMYTDRMPLLGESKCGHGMFSNLGGKGANQAIACKKLGIHKVYILASIGNDDCGKIMLSEIKKYGLDVSGIEINNSINSGSCFIIFDEGKKDNVILVDKGANLENNPAKVDSFLRNYAKKDDILITQLETNLDSIYKAIRTAKELGMYVIFNPAPVCEFNKEIIKDVNLLVINETEALLLSGVKYEKEEDLILIHKKLEAKSTLITLGGNGAYLIQEGKVIYSPAVKTEVIDTTCAGDTFIGALAYRKANNIEIKDSLKFAATCSSLTVSRKGAAQSIPSINEIKDIYKEEN